MSKIMIVEDDQLTRTCCARILTREGHEVVPFCNGTDAKNAAEHDVFDVAVVDYDIPGANGVEVLAALAGFQPQCGRILASGMLDLSVAVEAVNEGAVWRLLEKPFGWATLVSSVNDALAARVLLAKRYRNADMEAFRRERVMLQECLEGHTLKLAIQPIFNAVSRRMVAGEALLRSSHPVLKGPMEVLNAAERHDQLLPIGHVVAQCAAQWLDTLPDWVTLFINLHPAEFVNPKDLAKRLEPLIPWSERVVLEITERSYILDIGDCHETTKLLRELGFAIAVDDIGAGYSSLSIVAALEPQYIKVDMSIIRDVDSHPHKRRLLEMLCKFGRATGTLLIAEGVETEAEAAAVVECGVDMIQGYLLARPTFELAPHLLVRS